MVDLWFENANILSKKLARKNWLKTKEKANFLRQTLT